MPKREYLSQLELMVMFAILRKRHEAYGVPIAREIEDKSGREIALASIYAALERLQAKGLVTSSLGEPSAKRGGKARTYFTVTNAGLRELRSTHETLTRLSFGLKEIEVGSS